MVLENNVRNKWTDIITNDDFSKGEKKKDYFLKSYKLDATHD
jgi:hypothetical protein